MAEATWGLEEYIEKVVEKLDEADSPLHEANMPVRLARLEEVSEAFGTGGRNPLATDHPAVPVNAGWWKRTLEELARQMEDDGA